MEGIWRQSHYKATGKEPFAGLVVRTDTCGADGSRLELDWDEDALYCGSWHWDDERDGSIGVFALGVVKALGR